MAHTASEIPGTADVLINGEIYMADKSFDDSPFRRPPMSYGYTPTFLDRTNVSGNYGDDKQSFFLTASQNDWSLGEMRRYFRSTDPDGVRRYWSGTSVDPTTIPGQMTPARAYGTVSWTDTILSQTAFPSLIYGASSATLYHANSAGTVTSDGDHGLGASPGPFGMANDSLNIFLSTTSAGTVGVRRWNGSAFSTFSATGSDSLAFLNNVLYGYQESTGRLIHYSTGGVASTLFTWQDATGAALTGANYRTILRPYGGTLLILRVRGTGGRPELWQYDGTNISQLAEFPGGFTATTMAIASGVVLVGGYVASGSFYLPQVYYYTNGVVDKLWGSRTLTCSSAPGVPLFAFAEGAVWMDESTSIFYQYNFAFGGVHAVTANLVSAGTVVRPIGAANQSFLVIPYSNTSGVIFPLPGSVSNTVTLKTSLFDFDTSLLKYPRGVKVEFAAGSNGDGGSLDIAYQFESVDGSYTTLQTTAVSGTEYVLPTTQFHSISIKVTLNRGTSTYGPTLKRISVAAAPILTSYRTNTYLLDLSGNKNSPQSPGYVKLVTGVDHNKDGEEMRADLVTAIAAGPISITDRFGTFTGIIDPGQTTFREVRSQYGRAEYRCELAVRQIQ